ncbi:unnamed protein product [Oikopleura dioica]|uniref:PDZ domain-containing protein n=1 Tax=Oikopleura dioica TaxID=34765 RepID=E4YHN0_OIKDI|nr:unnamed protein product [Oikopleura dioica]
MSLARQNARKFLSLEQVCLVEEIFDDRQLRTHIFELLFDYSENAGTPEYQNWRLLLDEIDNEIYEPRHYRIFKLILEICNVNHLRAIAIDPRVPHPNNNFAVFTNAFKTGTESLGLTLRNYVDPNGSPELYVASVTSGQISEQAGLKPGDRIHAVGKAIIKNLQDFKTAIMSAKTNLREFTITVEKIGFIPSTIGSAQHKKIVWNRVPDYKFNQEEIPIRMNLSSFNLSYCSPGVFIMQASSKRDQNFTTARIGDEVTEINGIRTAEMNRDEFEVLQAQGITEVFYRESNSEELARLISRLNHAGINWNQTELDRLNERHQILFLREATEDKNKHLQRSTSRFTEMNSYVKPSKYYSDNTSEDGIEENSDKTRNGFLGVPDVDMDKSESEIDKVVEDLEGLAEKELSRESVRSVNYHGSGSDFVTAVALASRNSIDESDGSSSGVDEPHATSNVQSEPEPEESESSDSERETILLPDPEPESDEEPVQPPDEVKKELIPKISELERKFLKMLQENSKMASTIRISIPSSMRPRADMVFHLKIDFDENTVLVFCRNKYSQIAVKETSFQEIRPGDEIVKIRTLKVKEMNSSLSAVEEIFNNWKRSHQKFPLKISVSRRRGAVAGS